MKKGLLYLILFAFVCYQIQAQPDPWKITANKINPSDYYGITVANGMIGVVSSPEPFKVKAVVLAGTYDLYGRGRVSNFINSFNLLNMKLAVDGKEIDAKSVQNFKQELDMSDAAFSSSFDYGDQASISYSYYSLRQLPYCVMIEVTVKAKKDLSITGSSVMEAPDAIKDVQNYYNEIERPHVSIALLTSTGKSPTGKLQLCASTCFLFNEEHGTEPKITHEMWDNNMHLMKFTKSIKAGQSYSFSIVGTSISSVHNDDPLNEAERLTIFAKLEGHDRLLEFHKKAWKKLWESDITVEGDDQVQQDIHSMLYHLYSFSREGTAFSLSPMGLSGLGYNGHVFWDADLWMYPVLLVLHPEIAHSLIEYRFERLEAARKNAFSHGYQGAMYPWESAGTGGEETPVWALSGPFEHHISACVGMAAWNYYCVTQDKDWLKEKGWPILSATADFWTSRVERTKAGQFDIKNVVAADEWAENIDNDAFTNAAVKVNLQNAISAAKLLGYTPNPDWNLVSESIPILKMPNGVTQEFASYKGEGIKQADVNLLAYPLKVMTDSSKVRADLEYYETRVPNEGTPAMTQAIFALLWSRLGNGEKAYHFFKDSYIPNLNPPFRVIAETKGGTNPYFATGAGGILQCMLMGFGGLDITPSGITQIKSSLPPGWKSLKITGVGPEKKTFIVKAK
jgi:trehalose/maltose hydrolase-like predicted phosphorylase